MESCLKKFNSLSGAFEAPRQIGMLGRYLSGQPVNMGNQTHKEVFLIQKKNRINNLKSKGVFGTQWNSKKLE
jgi:hypothetical protein